MTHQVLNPNPRPTRIRDEAYKKLGVEPNAVACCPKIGPLLKVIANDGREAGFGPGEYILQIIRSSDDLLARRFLDRYDDITLSSIYRDSLPLEAFCLAAGINPSDFLGVIVTAAHKRAFQIGSLIASINHHKIMEASVAVAQLPLGVEDRMAHFKHMGHLPVPKGSQVNVQVQANAVAQTQQATVIAAPPAEDTIRRLNDRFNESRRELAASESRQLPAAPIDAEYVEADDV